MTDLLTSVIAAHGGLDRWRTVRAIDVTFNFSGGLLDLKGYPGHRRPSASVDAATPRTVFQRLGDESDDHWIFTANRVWIERRDGTIVEERGPSGHRRRSGGLISLRGGQAGRKNRGRGQDLSCPTDIGAGLAAIRIEGVGQMARSGS